MALSTAVDISAVARVVGIQTQFKNLGGNGLVMLPQRIAVIGQGRTITTFSTEKRQFTKASDVGAVYGYGSPLHLAALQLFPVNGDGVGTIPVTFYPLEDDDDGVAADGSITASGTATGSGVFRVYIGGVRSEAFTVKTGDTAASIMTAMAFAINSALAMPVTAIPTTSVGLTAKWAGESGNLISIRVDGPTDIGVTFAISDMSGGLLNPDVQPALDQFGDVWETMVLNTFNAADSDTLDTISTFGEGRWGALTRKPFVAFVGSTDSLQNSTPIGNSRPLDRTNAMLTAPGSGEMPLTVAARMLARIAKVANNNPARDYGSQQATGLAAGPDGDQWSYLDRDVAVKAGVSTSIVKDGVINIADTVTFYHPFGDPLPAYRFVCDIVKLQNALFNLDLIFATPEWDGAPLIPDDQPTSNREARKPKSAVAAVCAKIDALALEAIISDPETAKAATVAQISDQNPKRLELSTTVALSGNTNIISVDLNFGFYFGAREIVA